MNSLAVKALQERAKYIVDKYHYGIDCNSCKYEYEKYALLDMMSDCGYTTCEEDIIVISEESSSVDCTAVAPSEVEPVDCIPAVEILDCNQEYITQDTQALEANSFIYNEVVNLDNSLRFTFSEVIVNGVTYLSADRSLDITPANVNIEEIGSLLYVTNLVDFLNTLELPQMEFFPGLTQRTMKVKYPVGQTWQITTKANGDLDAEPHGIKVDQDGLVSLQISIGGAYNLPGTLVGTSYENNFNTNVSTVATETLC